MSVNKRDKEEISSDNVYIKNLFLNGVTGLYYRLCRACQIKKPKIKNLCLPPSDYTECVLAFGVFPGEIETPRK